MYSVPDVSESYRAKAKSQGDVELCHKTDGVIFQPNTPYVCGTDFGLLKWKFTDCITVDLAVQVASLFLPLWRPLVCVCA